MSTQNNAPLDIPEVFMPYQIEAASDQSNVVIIEKSRQIGITFEEAWNCALFAASEDGMDVFYVGYNYQMTKRFMMDAGTALKVYQGMVDQVYEGEYFDVLENGDIQKIKTSNIRCASGYIITALPSVPRSMRSIHGLIVIDEAAFVPHLRALIKAALATRTWGGRIRIISSHNGDDSYFNELIKRNKRGERDDSVHTYPFRLAVEQGLYQRICLATGQEYSKEAEEKWVDEMYTGYDDPLDAAEELDCIPRSSQDVYLPLIIIESVTQSNIPVIRLALDHQFTLRNQFEREDTIKAWCVSNLKPILDRLERRLNIFMGADFARDNDLSVIWLLQQSENLFSTVLVIELREIPFDQQKQILFYICERVNLAKGAVDGRGNGQYLAESLSFAYRSRFVETQSEPGVRASESTYAEYMPKLKAHFEARSITIPDDIDIINALRMIRLHNGIPKIPAKLKFKHSHGGEHHGDAAIALFMAIIASKQEVTLYEHHRVIPAGSLDTDSRIYENFLRPPVDEPRRRGGTFKGRVTGWKDI